MNIKNIAGKIFTSGLKKFSNIHKGETCYVFGDGPSIKWFDLSLFNDHPAICCGKIPFHKDFNKLDVRYVMLVEPWFFVPKLFQPKWLQEFNEISSEYKNFVKRTPGKEFFVSLSNRFSLSGANINYVFRRLPENKNRTDELLSRFNLFSGSFYATLTLAYYIGFSKIYLVGFDAWTIQPPRNIRFYELGEGEPSDNVPGRDELLEIFKNEADIYTITPYGQSRNVTSISYRNYTGMSPVYKENYQIVDDCYLKILSSYPRYKIYPDSL